MSNTPDIDKGSRIVKELLDWLDIEKTASTERTPERVAKMYLEMFKGLYKEPPVLTTFENKKETYVAVSNIHFSSVCEHHLLPFTGICGVVYYADKKVIGLSKIPRLVKYYCQRPQLQERLTEQIAVHLMSSDLNPKGVYVEMSAEHTCMTIRGIEAKGSVTNTSTIEGVIDKYEAHRLLHSDSLWGKR